MRFSTSILVAAGAAAVLAAPIREEAFDPYDECDNEDFTSHSEAPHTFTHGTHSHTTAVPLTTSASISASSIVIATSLPTIESSSSPVSIVEASSSTIVSVPVQTSASSVAAIVASSTPVSSSSAEGVVASSSSAIADTSSASVSSSASSSASTGALEFLGVNESGAEFGSTDIPGTLGTDYTWPNTSAIQILMDKGMNIFRIPFLMERLAQGTMTASLDATYLAALKTTVEFITTAGGHAIVDPHNFGRYDGTIFTSTSDFQTFWTNVATEFATNDNVIFDCNNEFHDEPSNTVVADLNQACIDGVRAAGATTQYIFVEGTSYTGAWTWVSSGNSVAMANLTDPSDKIVYEMHQYLDSDGSGTSATCVSTTIGAERIAAATSWLQENGKKGIIGEFAGGANSDCETAVTGMLDALAAASDVWMGALWWGGGPWWGDYIYSMEPPSGTAYVPYIDILTKYI
ncbi:glycoside hydrolase [Mollisia scopiformis]|uniref:cellulase n=1 Tax=Mollisia scopiformis TaxID=149040 RepID=A0A194XP70_MOLSC|nr:glycoside hydrolase [Mollisia scopiformis]KUJ21983.1 glycoside hydrolase [Mollisia scopiformis]